MVHRTMGLPHKSEPKNSYCVIWVYRGEKSPEDKEKRKLTELGQIAKEVFHAKMHLSYNELVERIMQTVDVKDRTAKSYISYMRNNGIIEQQTNNLYNLKL